MKINADLEKINNVLWDAYIKGQEEDVVMDIGDDVSEDWIVHYLTDEEKEQYVKSAVTYQIKVKKDDSKTINLLCKKGQNTTMKLASFVWGSMTPSMMTRIVAEIIDDSYEIMKWCDCL